MTSLVELGAHLPPQSATLAELAAPLGMSEQDVQVYTKFLGMSEVRVAGDADYGDLLVAAGRTLTALRGQEHRVRYVIAARSMQITGMGRRNPLHEAAARLGVPHAVTLTLTQRFCSGTLTAIDLAGRLLDADGDADGLAVVLAGEKCIPHTFSQLVDGVAVMGDSTAACLVAPAGDRDVVLSVATRRLARFGTLTMAPEEYKEYSRLYAPTISAVVHDALDRAGVALADVALVLPHHVNVFSWRGVCKELGLARDRVHLDLLPVTGHCFGADQLIAHVDAARKARLEQGDLYLMVATGLGGEFAAMVLRR
ncbi:3-oxoacyl-ACP synthase [Cellulomonas sp. JZ18]|uniref:3-oxoacyl-[acyl-carrier-protein] synthase III C-terminal domain-containing protein n=1 Tax=Cellulomonas sp. JZ18 TaxID=2654191 RepID=UPI0012D4624C|nr:3-oxoacyl-[acyl-carrier-protein] synthase III C-terminal domain-containing protein [Cellulomonas sp. JZ18]QGQ18369.1 3-oxoacyl-ACP synthase [Cellulomonas sp. JZ18]